MITKRLLDSLFAFTALVLGWLAIPVAPTTPQLIALGLFGLFALLILAVRK